MKCSVAQLAVVAATTAALTASGGGCSALASRPPPDRPLRDRSECSRSVAPPIMDVVGAASSGVTGAVLLAMAATKGSAQEEAEPSWNLHRRSEWSTATYVLVGVSAEAVAAALAVSTAYGFRSVQTCRLAARELRQRERELLLLEAPLPPPGQAPPPWSPSIPVP